MFDFLRLRVRRQTRRISGKQRKASCCDFSRRALHESSAAAQCSPWCSRQPRLPTTSVAGGHLPAVAKNLELVGELEPAAAQGPMVDGQIADLAVFKNYAYLNSWDEPSCTKGGVYVVNIEDPFHPVESGFIPARSGYYHGEGAHAFTLETPQSSRAICSPSTTRPVATTPRPAEVPGTAGGFDLYDVTDPDNPETLDRARAIAPRRAHWSRTRQEFANSAHSSTSGRTGPAPTRSSSTTPSCTTSTSSTSPIRGRPSWSASSTWSSCSPRSSARRPTAARSSCTTPSSRRSTAACVMLANYWDAGYVQLDVTDPSDPKLITDTEFADIDPAIDRSPSEAPGGQRPPG